MKKNIWMVLLVLLLATCSQGEIMAQNLMINADKKTNTDFSKYKSFYWATQVDRNLDPGLYFLNDLVLKDRIRNAVSYELEGRGYRLTPNMPDLVVNFRVFSAPTTLKGFSDYGTTYWGSEELRSPDDVRTYQVDAGTMLISLLDRAQGKVVWQGFVSGLTNANGFDRTENRIKQAVNLLFEEYNQRADNLQSRGR